MRFICPRCHKILIRDLRNRITKSHLRKRGYVGYCDETGHIVYMKPIGNRYKYK